MSGCSQKRKIVVVSSDHAYPVATGGGLGSVCGSPTPDNSVELADNKKRACFRPPTTKTKTAAGSHCPPAKENAWPGLFGCGGRWNCPGEHGGRRDASSRLIYPDKWPDHSPWCPAFVSKRLCPHPGSPPRHPTAPPPEFSLCPWKVRQWVV